MRPRSNCQADSHGIVTGILRDDFAEQLLSRRASLALSVDELVPAPPLKGPFTLRRVETNQRTFVVTPSLPNRWLQCPPVSDAGDGEFSAPLFSPLLSPVSYLEQIVHARCLS